MAVFVSSFTQGVSVRRVVTLSSYPPPTWSLRLVLVQADAQEVIDATADGTDHVLALTAAESAAYAVGTWDYQAFVTDGTDRHMVGSGRVEVLPDYETASSGIDTRTAIEKNIEAIEAVLAGSASKDQRRAKYGDREIERYSPTELIQILNHLRQELRRQHRRPGWGKVRVRFR